MLKEKQQSYISFWLLVSNTTFIEDQIVKHCQRSEFQGLFSRITFAQPVLLGGTGSFRNTEHFLDVESGFRGCIRRLEINNKIYNFEPSERQGDAIFGMDIGEFRESEFRNKSEKIRNAFDATRLSKALMQQQNIT